MSYRVKFCKVSPDRYRTIFSQRHRRKINGILTYREHLFERYYRLRRRINNLPSTYPSLLYERVRIMYFNVNASALSFLFYFFFNNSVHSLIILLLYLWIHQTYDARSRTWYRKSDTHHVFLIICKTYILNVAVVPLTSLVPATASEYENSSAEVRRLFFAYRSYIKRAVLTHHFNCYVLIIVQVLPWKEKERCR